MLELSSLVSTLSLEDVWRRRNTTNKSFTFKRNNSQSRLDYFLCSKVINNEIEQTNITPCLLSDHSFVEIKINTNLVERGPGLWILNNSRLDNSDHSNLINSYWLSWRLKKSEFSCLFEWWEMAKHNIKQISIHFSKEHKHQTENISKIEKELLILKEMPYSISTCTKIENIEKRIERYYNNNYNAFVVRSKAKFAENNELSSKYKDDEGNVKSGLDSNQLL